MLSSHASSASVLDERSKARLSISEVISRAARCRLTGSSTRPDATAGIAVGTAAVTDAGVGDVSRGVSGTRVSPDFISPFAFEVSDTAGRVVQLTRGAGFQKSITSHGCKSPSVRRTGEIGVRASYALIKFRRSSRAKTS